jgi:hypothetical protein
MTDAATPEASPTARRLIDELRPHTPFAEAIVRRQAERAGVPVDTLSDADLPRVVPLVVAAASGFVDPVVLARLRWVFLRR